MIEKIERLVLLFDFYGELLTERQQKIFKLYYFQDFSLGEIAEEYNISRQAIYDIIKRTEELLVDYENKLKLYEKFICQKEELHKLYKLLDEISEDYKDARFNEALNNINNILKSISKD